MKAHPRADLFIAQVGDEREPRRELPRPGQRRCLVTARNRRADRISGGLEATSRARPRPRSRWRPTVRRPGPTATALVAQARQWYRWATPHRAAERTRRRVLRETSHGSTTWLRAPPPLTDDREQQYLTDALDLLKGANLDAAVTWSEFAAFAAADLCGVLGAPGAPDEAARAQGLAGCSRPPGRRESSARARTRSGSRAVRLGRDRGEQRSGRCRRGSPSEPGVLPGGARNGGGRTRLPARPQPVGREHDRWVRAAFAAVTHITGRASSGRPSPSRSRGRPGTTLDRHGPEGPAARNVLNSARIVYTDNLENYVTSEPAIDYTANSILLLAALGGNVPRRGWRHGFPTRSERPLN